MKTTRIQELLEKHIAFNCNQSEQEELAKLIESMSDDLLKPELLKLLEQYEPTTHISEKEKERKLNAILNADKPTIKLQRKSVSFNRRVVAVAASVVILFSIGLFTLKLDNRSSEQAMVLKAPTASPDRATSYIRHLTLPDGTSVILKSGSTLHFPEEFRGRTREVILSGEAYFDVKHMNSKPFIIHTGNVKTTVLGTAFDVKAWPGQKNVIVSVTRGKVRVEDDKKVLAVLVRNEQLKYNGVELAEVVKKVVAEKIVTDWTKEDMVFDHVALGSIAQTLGNRYGVNITITNLQLAKAEIVSAFSGTESLQNVLDVLCTINPNTHFNIKEKEVVISNN